MDNSADHSLLVENDSQRLYFSIPLLLCFAVFVTWRIGIVHFSGMTLSVDGGTNLPIPIGDLDFVILAGYVLSIVWMIFLPRYIVRAQRVTAGMALLSALAFYLPLPPETLSVLYYFLCFCCMFLLGFENAVVTYLFREKTAILYLTLAYALAMFLIALLQNDIVPVSFEIFQIFMIVVIAAQLFFYCKLPSRSWPRYVTKADGLVFPVRFFIGAFALGVIGSLMFLFGAAISETIPSGESIYFCALGTSGVIVFILWKKWGISILRLGLVAMGIAAFGFMLALLSLYLPVLSVPACIVLGCGGIVCWFGPFFCLTLAKLYPSRFISPLMIGLCYITVLLHSVLLDVFRATPRVSYAGYLVIAVGLGMLYLFLEPYLSYSFYGKTAAHNTVVADEAPEQAPVDVAALLQSSTSDKLTGQELRVAELLLRGFTYTEAARTLKLQPNTVKWHQKNLYAKLHINSKRELFALAEQDAGAPSATEKPGRARPLLSTKG